MELRKEIDAVSGYYLEEAAEKIINAIENQTKNLNIHSEIMKNEENEITVSAEFTLPPKGKTTFGSKYNNSFRNIPQLFRIVSKPDVLKTSGTIFAKRKSSFNDFFKKSFPILSESGFESAQQRIDDLFNNKNSI